MSFSCEPTALLQGLFRAILSCTREIFDCHSIAHRFCQKLSGGECGSLGVTSRVCSLLVSGFHTLSPYISMSGENKGSGVMGWKPLLLEKRSKSSGWAGENAFRLERESEIEYFGVIAFWGNCLLDHDFDSDQVCHMKDAVISVNHWAIIKLS